MPDRLFSSDLWRPALEKYAEATGLTVRLFGADAEGILATVHPTPLIELFQEYGFEPGLFAECARRCLRQTTVRPAVAVAELHGLAVVGTSLVLEGTIVGAAVAGYALTHFSQVPTVQRWAKTAAVPFDRLWSIVRQHSPTPERRLMLQGELLQVLGDTLLRENYRTRQYEDAIVKLEAAAAAKDDFLAILSHELRTPLSPILGWANILQKSDSTETRHAAEIIERNVWHQARMIEDLLDMNLIAHGTVKLDLRNHELSALVREAVEASAAEIEKKGIRVEFAEAGEQLIVEGDAGRLQQVFRNILSNAAKFTSEGGRIRVAVTREPHGAQVVVADTGIGIAPEFLPRMFDLFEQQEKGTRRKYEGLGIGLALVKQITELHKGTASIASGGIGRGTEVTVRLPLVSGTAALEDAAAVSEQPAASALTGLSILVVEDSADALHILQILLEHLGAKVTVAGDGREALVRIQNARPDLVLCDLRMPRMDGFEFIHELHRAKTSATPPVVAMSGLASEADRRRTQEAGFEAHIMKPFDTATVTAAIRTALKARAGHVAQPHP